MAPVRSRSLPPSWRACAQRVREGRRRSALAARRWRVCGVGAAGTATHFPVALRRCPGDRCRRRGRPVDRRHRRQAVERDNAFLCWLIMGVAALGILCVFLERWHDVEWFATHVVRSCSAGPSRSGSSGATPRMPRSSARCRSRTRQSTSGSSRQLRRSRAPMCCRGACRRRSGSRKPGPGRGRRHRRADDHAVRAQHRRSRADVLRHAAAGDVAEGLSSRAAPWFTGSLMRPPEHRSQVVPDRSKSDQRGVLKWAAGRSCAPDARARGATAARAKPSRQARGVQR